jgi:hypothetical protein
MRISLNRAGRDGPGRDRTCDLGIKVRIHKQRSVATNGNKLHF